MTNWEKDRDEVKMTADRIFGTKMDKGMTYGRAVMEAIGIVSNKNDPFEAIDWLTQEAETCETCEHENSEFGDCLYCTNNSEYKPKKAESEEVVCRYSHNGICEMRTVDEKCEGTKELMEYCTLLTKEEKAESKVFNSDSDEEVDYHNSASSNPTMVPFNTGFEPQSKARFIQNEEDYINIQHISSISEVENKTYIFVDGNEHAFIIDKPIDEVIKQLGIEVV